ncbi:hypothetical protein K450DRAFT_178871 [Umbelopsis ramanniana AG]|uniref:Uncharacterized protein n=1 Tax=Umbelopsis ramanniana AG TaxID=1314678 RepID=A0AAD5E4U4_UMBRA|nr:uncharacterized protein K450DRAFT_178871 [Umbelopsis ramanniana AG]KAI8576709.1 hypothetical protein K450DRAFT_178871 [Umbelopsis ramanniana AG]
MFKLSRQVRIIILLVINTLFFLAEIIIGYRVGSLALVADSFHMLNDMISLVIALWAVKVAARTEFESKYSYGWQRAEVLGALINGVFLLALCFTLLIDCIERFISPQIVTEPVLVLITGCVGLAANLFGLVLFHEHGHSHGHSHSHSTNDNVSALDIAPAHISRDDSHATLSNDAKDGIREANRLPSSPRIDDVNRLRDSIDRNTMHPSVARDLIVQHARQYSSHDVAHDYGSSSGSEQHHHHEEGESEHSQQNLNMRGVFLHVVGDALGNIGVVISALIIWLTPYSWRFYFDPLISLIITIIIFSSALPLVRSTSFILLQGVPNTIAIDDVRRELYKTADVLSVHELHIWQLSDTKTIASLHVLLSSTSNYMTVAQRVRKLMHRHGIHSITIQPEFVDPDSSGDIIANAQIPPAESNTPQRQPKTSWWANILPWSKKKTTDEEKQVENSPVCCQKFETMCLIGTNLCI